MSKIKNIFVFLLIQAFYIISAYPSVINISSFTCDSLDHDYNEDRICIKEYKDLGLKIFAVFDGHAGSEVSQYLQDNFVDVIYNLLNSELSKNKEISFKDILKNACEEINVNLFNMYKQDILFDKTKNKSPCPGSTATGACFYDNKIYIFNVGDSRTCLWDKDGLFINCTNFQKASLENEITKKIINNGAGFLSDLRIFSNTKEKFFYRYLLKLNLNKIEKQDLNDDKFWIVLDKKLLEIEYQESEKIKKSFSNNDEFYKYYNRNMDSVEFSFCGYICNTENKHRISMESAFGDFDFKKYGFEAVPEIQVIDQKYLDDNLKYLVIASDGLWDIADRNSDNIFNMLNELYNIKLEDKIIGEKLNIALNMCHFARKYEGSKDDISVICVVFN